jgi:phosphoglycolate phosphatase-like HAD superfamily hydrolase
MIILVDIDHTVSNAFWRDSMIGVESWDHYHENSKYDKPFKNVVNLLNALSNSGYEIMGITGRNEKNRPLTVGWLVQNKVDIDELLMRPDDDFTKNGELKVRLVRERFKDDFKDIHFLIDDNEDAVLAFMALGIATLQIRNIK